MTSDEENVIRAIFTRWNAGVWEVDGALVHPEVELHSAMTNSVWRGHVGVQAWIDEIREQFETWFLELSELREVGPGNWLGLGEIKARGKTSGLNLDQTAGWMFRFRDGKVDRLQTFISHQEAEAFAQALVR